MIECKKKQVMQAIMAIKHLNEKFFEDESKKKPLIEESPIFLQITMKKVPSSKLLQLTKVPLPNTLVRDMSDVCLITGDLEKRNRKAEIEPTVLHYKELLKQHGIKEDIEVIPLRQLRTEYKAYEAKRQLVAAYDMFLADNKIAGVLPRLLGKFFFKKRKFPIQINMKSPNLKGQIEKASSNTVFFFSSHGNSCTAEVANLNMTVIEVMENILAAVKVLCEQVPGALDNIMGIFVKTSKSKAIPIYMSYGNPNEVKFKKSKVKEVVEAEELSTLPNKKVKVFRDGKIIIQNCKTESESEDDSYVNEKVLLRKKNLQNRKKKSFDKSNKSANSHSELADCDEKFEIYANSNTIGVSNEILANSEGKPSLKRKKASKKNIKRDTSGENELREYTEEIKPDKIIEEMRRKHRNDSSHFKKCKSIEGKTDNHELKRNSKKSKIITGYINREKGRSPWKITKIDKSIELIGNKSVEGQNKISQLRKKIAKNKFVAETNPFGKHYKMNKRIDKVPERAVTGKKEFLKRRQFNKLKKKKQSSNNLNTKNTTESKIVPSPQHKSATKKIL